MVDIKGTAAAKSYTFWTIFIKTKYDEELWISAFNLSFSHNANRKQRLKTKLFVTPAS